MNYRHNSLIVLSRYILAFVIIAISFCFVGCNNNPKTPNTPNNQDTPTRIKPDSNRISWNVLFPPGTNSVARAQTIREIRAYVDTFYLRYNQQRQTKYHADIDTAVCNCDTLLYNINFVPLDESGQSVTTAPAPAAPGQAGETVSFNDPISDSSTVVNKSDKRGINLNAKYPIDDSKILAIIDSGVDSTLLPPLFANMLWKDPTSPGSTLYNFIPEDDKFNKFDNTLANHGTAVAAIILKTMEKARSYPKIMVLKALDAKGAGSIFSVSCALSYAIQKNATIVNMSLGYYGEKPDSILHHYLELAQQKPKYPIEIFVAAGNTPGKHDLTKFCDNPTTPELGNPEMFYPACFTTDLGNITSVTQIRREDTPCIYQNYSNKFISLGIYDKQEKDKKGICCILPAYLNDGTRYYDGSSFATPVASGLKMSSLLAGGDSWPPLINRNSSRKVTVDGKFIVYPPNP